MTGGGIVTCLMTLLLSAQPPHLDATNVWAVACEYTCTALCCSDLAYFHAFKMNLDHGGRLFSLNRTLYRLFVEISCSYGELLSHGSIKSRKRISVSLETEVDALERLNT